MHKSRLSQLIIDCQGDDLERYAAFWSAALGGSPGRHSEDGRYIDVEGNPDDPGVILQKVEHASRVHIDIETDDIPAEVRRLQALGATVVEKMQRWTVMQAPSGHRFCVIGARRDGFDAAANRWD